MTFDVVSIGSALIDTYISSEQFILQKDTAADGGSSFVIPVGAKLELNGLETHVGGGGANTSTAFARLGLQTALVSRIGQDGSGLTVKSALQLEGVHLEAVKVDPDHKTGRSFLLRAATGDRSALSFRGAGRGFTPQDIPESLLRHSAWVYLSSVGGDLPTLTRIFAYSRIHGVKIAWNPGGLELALGLQKLRPLLESVDILLLNVSEAARLVHGRRETPEELVLQAQRLTGDGTAILTDGARGAWLRTQELTRRNVGHAVVPLETTGAGDAFGSGFVGAYVIESDVDKALAFATKNAESVIGQIGPRAGLLKRESLP
jgi:ribokinase